VHWIGPVALVVALILTFFTWIAASPDGKTVYLGGSVHSLRESDYPLPAAYQRAFAACSRIAFEVDARALTESTKALVQNGKYRKGDSLKNHVDARTYAYVRRLFELMNVPESSFSQYRPWFIVLVLQSGSTRNALPKAGVDEFFMKQAAKRSMPVVGLESVQEHARVYSGLTDREIMAQGRHRSIKVLPRYVKRTTDQVATGAGRIEAVERLGCRRPVERNPCGAFGGQPLESLHQPRRYEVERILRRERDALPLDPRVVRLDVDPARAVLVGGANDLARQLLLPGVGRDRDDLPLLLYGGGRLCHRGIGS
jgi:hypothetical protein